MDVILFLLVSILLISLLPFYLILVTSHRGQPLPPGRMGWPVVGESLEFVSAGRRGVPEQFFKERMKMFSTQVFKTSLLRVSTAVFCGPSGNKFLFSNENKLVSLWWPRSVDKVFPSASTSNTSIEEAKRVRKLAVAFLKPEALQRYIGTMDAMAKMHLQTKWATAATSTVHVNTLVKTYTFALACKLFMSVEDTGVVAKLEKRMTDLAGGILSIPLDLPGSSFRRGIEGSRWMRRELMGIVKKRKSDLLLGSTCGGDHHHHQNRDMLSHMLENGGDHETSTLSEEDVVNKIMGLLIGGHDTASCVITCFIKYMAELPHIYDLVLKEQREIAKSKRPGELLNWDDIQKMRHTWNVACEVMRLWAPVQGGFKEALTDFTYAGFFIPKGFKLYWSANTTHKNPDYFEEPEKFDPWRFDGMGPAPYTYVPFGGGARTCPGKEYARLEILAFMHNLVNKYRWEKVIADEKIIVDPMPEPAKGLPIRLYPH
ncbi:hypothetical protein Syun_024709 [Stephania yunnanensis]|uniref:Cytochrome P450 n=1 Tax=Stephania yunnanensis TaxID=152371 RepID=A0AAP0HTY1_9MAGN